MAKGSGGTRTSRPGRTSYTASVSVINKRDETRWLQKDFSTQKQAEAWIDKVARRFDSPAKSGFAINAAIDKNTKNGTEYDIFNRDLAKEFEKKDKKAFMNGYR